MRVKNEKGGGGEERACNIVKVNIIFEGACWVAWRERGSKGLDVAV